MYFRKIAQWGILIVILIFCYSSLVHANNYCEEWYARVQNDTKGEKIVAANWKIKESFKDKTINYDYKLPYVGSSLKIVELEDKFISLLPAFNDKYLIVRSLNKSEIVIYDVEKLYIVKTINVPDKDFKMATGGSLLIIYMPKTNIFQKWDLSRLERIETKLINFDGLIKYFVMGKSNSNIALILLVDKELGLTTGFKFLDTAKMILIDAKTSHRSHYITDEREYYKTRAAEIREKAKKYQLGSKEYKHELSEFKRNEKWNLQQAEFKLKKADEYTDKRSEIFRKSAIKHKKWAKMEKEKAPKFINAAASQLKKAYKKARIVESKAKIKRMKAKNSSIFQNIGENSFIKVDRHLKNIAVWSLYSSSQNLIHCSRDNVELTCNATSTTEGILFPSSHRGKVFTSGGKIVDKELIELHRVYDTKISNRKYNPHEMDRLVPIQNDNFYLSISPIIEGRYRRDYSNKNMRIKCYLTSTNEKLFELPNQYEIPGFSSGGGWRYVDYNSFTYLNHKNAFVVSIPVEFRRWKYPVHKNRHYEKRLYIYQLNPVDFLSHTAPYIHFLSEPTITTFRGGKWKYELAAISSAPPISYTLIEHPIGMKLSNKGIEWLIPNDANDTIKVKILATDASHRQKIQSFNIRVEDLPLIPPKPQVGDPGFSAPKIQVQRGWKHDGAGNIARQIVKDPTGIIEEEHYMYMPGGILKTSKRRDVAVNGTLTDVAVENDYDAVNRVVRTMNPALNRTEYTDYDIDGRIIGRATEGSDGLFGTLLEYNARSLVKKEIAGAASVSSNQECVNIGSEDFCALVYDVSLVSQQFVIEFGYDISGRVTHEARTNVRTGSTVTTNFTYDVNGNVTRKTVVGGGPPALNEYNKRGWLLTSQRGSHKTFYTYDIQGNIVRTEDNIGKVHTAFYNGIGLKLYETINGQKTRNVYTAGAKALKKIYPDGAVYNYAYTGNGHLMIQEIPGVDLGDSYVTLRTEYERNGLGQLVSKIKKIKGKPKSMQITHLRQNWGNVVCHSDEENRMWSIFRDADGRVLKIENDGRSYYQYTRGINGSPFLIEDPIGNKTTIKHDVNGNITSIKYPSGNIIKYEYTPFNAKKKIYSDDSTDHFEYIGGNILTGLNNQDISISIKRDTNAQISAVKFGDYNLKYKTNPIGQVERISNKKLNIDTKYSYNRLGKLASIVDAKRHITKLYYDFMGRETRRVLPNGDTVITGYNFIGNPLAQYHLNISGETQSVKKWIYDINGNVLSFKHNLSKYVYTYDKTSRLTSAMNPDSSFWKYKYDNMGNLIEVKSKNLTTSFKYDSAYRILEINDKNRNITYQFSKDGTLVKKKTPHDEIVYSWDSFIRLRGIVRSNGETAAYKYDPANRLIERLTNKSKIEYIWDISGTKNLLAEIEDNGSKIKTYTSTRNQGDIVSISYTDSDIEEYTLYTNFNQMHKIKLSKKNNFREELLYLDEPYGADLVLRSSSSDMRQYHRNIYDSFSELSYHRQRWYDPEARRFISPRFFPKDELKPTENHPYIPYALNPITVGQKK